MEIRCATVGIEEVHTIPSQSEVDAFVRLDWRIHGHDRANELIRESLDAKVNNRCRAEGLDDLDVPAAVGLVL